MTVEEGGKSLGNARHWHPVASTYWMALKTSRKVRLARAPQASLFGQHRFDDRPFFVCHVAFVASAVTFIILPSGPVPRHVIPPSGVVTNSEDHMSGPLTTLGTDSETFTRLTPCVLMSPLSVAQYLPPDQALFDMVIFDEASQITTWDAIGTIARGRQSVIVGDSKQLPPTNFFGRADNDEEEDLAFYEQDLSSILDEAQAAGLPEHQLNWHYRSRDEALIAFSNHHYYGDRLVTFPSPRTQSNAVRFHFVQGIYARVQDGPTRLRPRQSCSWRLKG